MLKKFLLSIAEYVFCFAIFLFMDVGMHEWCHLWTLVTLGGEGHIRIVWYGAECVIDVMPPQWYAPTLVALAGGIGVFIISAIIFIWDWADDPEEASAITPIMLKNLVYGIFEGCFVWQMPPAEFLKWASLICGITFAIGILISIAIWVKYCLLRIIK